MKKDYLYLSKNLDLSNEGEIVQTMLLAVKYPKILKGPEINPGYSLWQRIFNWFWRG